MNSNTTSKNSAIKKIEPDSNQSLNKVLDTMDSKLDHHIASLQEKAESKNEEIQFLKEKIDRLVLDNFKNKAEITDLKVLVTAKSKEASFFPFGLIRNTLWSNLSVMNLFYFLASINLLVYLWSQYIKS